MNKKFLSAILFGALLASTTGTFTSCKDYDDDINNLQEQINTVVSDLASLKSQIATQYVQSVTFNDETGELIVTTMASGSSSSKTYIVKTTATEVADVKVEIKGQELVVNGEVIGKVGDTVTVDENGELTINGTATGIKVGKYAILTDQSQGTVTIQIPNASGEMETVTLMTSAAALTAVQFQNEDNVFKGAIDGDIEYGLAGIDHADWAGSKGAVKRNQLLVGQISTIDVQVTPADYDLGAQTLTLQNSLGSTIDVNVKATPNEMLLTRAASKSGSWTLSIEMNENVTVDNIKNVFGDKLYTLCVNGKPFTTFDIKGDVAKEKQGKKVDLEGKVVNLEYISGGNKKDVKTNNLPLGKTTELTAVFEEEVGNNLFDKMYDSYITFEGTQAERAKAFEISADGMSITTGSKAAGVEITATIHTMSVTGNIATSEVKFKVATSTATAQTVETTTYTLAPARTIEELLKPIVIDLGDVFSQIDVATLEQVKNAGQLVLSNFDNKFLLDNAGNLYGIDGAIAKGKVALLKADNSTWSDGDFESRNDVLSDGLLSLRYIKLDPMELGLKKTAEPGKYNLTLVATDAPDANAAQAENQILKITIPVEIKVPAFSEMFAKNYTTDNFEARITPTTIGMENPDHLWNDEEASAGLTLSTAFKIVETTYNADASKLAFAFETFKNGKYPVTNLDEAYNEEQHNAIKGSNTVAILDKELFYNGTSLVADTDMKNMVAYYSVFDILEKEDELAADWTPFELKAFKENFTVTSESYTTTVKAALDGIKLAYYVNKEAKDLTSYEVTLQTNGSIKPLTFDGDGNPVEGLALVFGDDIVPVGYAKDGDGKVVLGYGYDNALAGYYKVGVNNLSTTKDVKSGASISTGAIEWNDGCYKVSGMKSGEAATVTITLKDASGIEYPLTLRVRK